MSESPFSKPPIPAFEGILGKIQMALTIKAAIESKKDFVDSVKAAAKRKAMQKATEIIDAKIKEAREKGKSEASMAKKKQEEATAKATSQRSTAAAKNAALTSTPTAAVTSAKDIPEAIEESPELKILKQQRAKLVESINTVQAEYQEKTKEWNKAKDAALKGMGTTEYQEKLLPAFIAAELQSRAIEVQLRQLSSKLTDIDAQIESEIIKITG